MPNQKSSPQNFPAVRDKTILGKDTAGQHVVVSDTDRQSGMYILGVQGVGKSSLLEQLIYQDIAKGYAVIVLDPHGDLIENIIAQMPEKRLADAHLLDIEDTAYPFGLNVFAAAGSSDVDQAQALDRVLHVFEKCFPETSRMLLEKYLGNIAPVFFAHPGYAITDIPRFLRDEAFRASLLGGVRLFVREFWEQDFGSMSASRRQTETASLSTRINRFMRSPISGNIIGQSKTTIDFRKAIEQKKILLIRLPIKTLKEDASLIGTMLVAQIYAAIFSFAHIPFAKRPGFSLFVDEFQHFATTDFAEMLTEGRKFGARVCVAHQGRWQLPDALASATLTAYSKVCFQTTPEDAPKMAPLFVKKEDKVRKEDIVPDVVRHLLTYGHPNPTIGKLIKVYLRPVAMVPKVKQQIVITTYETPSLQKFLYGEEIPMVKDPLPFLSPFLYEVQIKENWRLPIPLDVIYGFSNCGVGYYTILKSCTIEQLIALSKYETVMAPDGAQTTVAPIYLSGRQDQIDTLWDILVTLRQVMVILASAPVGEKRQVTPSEVVEQLLSLPKRYALVRGGKGITHIQTLNTPLSVAETFVTVRRKQVQEQARKTYCRPRDVVEKEIEERQNSPSTDRSGPSPKEKKQANSSRSAGSEQGSTSEDLVCPHCGKKQTNKRFCSLCGGDLRKRSRFSFVDEDEEIDKE